MPTRTSSSRREVFADWTDDPLPADLPADTPLVPCGDFDLVADQFEHGFDAASYVRAMDAQGIDAVVLYPSIGLFVPYLPTLTPDQSAAACRSYNDWITEYCAHDPMRMAAAGLVPLADVDLAVAEAKRIHDLDLVGVMVRPEPSLRPQPRRPRLRPAVVRVLRPRSHRVGPRRPRVCEDRRSAATGSRASAPATCCRTRWSRWRRWRRSCSTARSTAIPTLKVAFLESGTGWLPYWLARLDDHIEWMSPDRQSATELFDRHCIISSEADDDCVGMVVDHLGPEYVVWASDFPHPDAIYPGAPVAFLKECDEQGMDEDDVKVILWDAPLCSTASSPASRERR